jgi:hypothetical protein
LTLPDEAPSKVEARRVASNIAKLSELPIGARRAELRLLENWLKTRGKRLPAVELIVQPGAKDVVGEMGVRGGGPLMMRRVDQSSCAKLTLHFCVNNF